MTPRGDKSGIQFTVGERSVVEYKRFTTAGDEILQALAEAPRLRASGSLHVRGRSGGKEEEKTQQKTHLLCTVQDDRWHHHVLPFRTRGGTIRVSVIQRPCRAQVDRSYSRGCEAKVL